MVRLTIRVDPSPPLWSVLCEKKNQGVHLTLDYAIMYSVRNFRPEKILVSFILMKIGSY